MLLRVAAFAPDQPDLDVGATDALNVYAGARSYLPLPAFADYSTNALTARAQGGASFRASDGTAYTFSGDATKLYLLSNTGAWQDVSGTTYACPADRSWFFIQFGDLIIAGNGFNAAQKFSIGSSPSTVFANLGGSPPVPIYGAVVGDFVVFIVDGGIVQWSGINNAETWATSSVTQADQQQMPDGELITGISGREYGTIFQEQAIRRMTYTADAFIFRFDKIHTGVGCTIPGSLASAENRDFFIHRSGVFQLIEGAQLSPIGAQRVNRYFWDDVDAGALVLISAATDHTKHLYAVLYASAAGSGSPDSLLLYNWEVDDGQMGWSRARPGDLEFIFSAVSQASLTLEDLDVYGSLEAVPYSLDSLVWAGVPIALFGAFDTTHMLQFANGGAMAASVVTSEAAPGGYKRALLRALMPMIQGAATITVEIGTRETLQAAVSYGAAQSPTASGAVLPRPVSSRYFRARINTAASDAWTHMLGVEIPDDGFRVLGRR